MDPFLCDLKEDHLVIDPKVLNCGLTACKSCLAEIIQDETLYCTKCHSKHKVNLDELPTNNKIQTLIEQNIDTLYLANINKFERILKFCQNTLDERERLVERRYDELNQDVINRVMKIQSRIDELKKQMQQILNMRQKQVMKNLNDFNNKWSDEYVEMRERLILMKIIGKEINEQGLDFEIALENIRYCEKNCQVIAGYLRLIDSFLNEYEFEKSEWLATHGIIGRVLNTRHQNIENLKENQINFIENIKVSKFCAFNNDLIGVRAKNSLKLWVYKKDFEGEREIFLVDEFYQIKRQTELSICSDNQENLFVCDMASGNILTIDREFKMVLKCFGSNGKGNIEFDKPVAIAYHKGCLFVLDKNNHRVQVITKAGNFVNDFSTVKSNKSNDYLDKPKFLAVSDDIIAVADGIFGICVYSFDGLLKLLIIQDNIRSICMFKNYLFVHTNQGVLTCFQINSCRANKIYSYDLVFTRLDEALRCESKCIQFINGVVFIAFPKQRKIVMISACN